MLVTCSNKEKIDHCKYHCFHGGIHDKGNERKDVCTTFEFCNITNKRVRCRKLYKKKLKMIKGEI